MIASSLFRLRKGAGWDHSCYGHVESIRFDYGTTPYHPGLDPNTDELVMAGSRFEIPSYGESVPFQIPFYRYLGSIRTQAGVQIYEVTLFYHTDHRKLYPVKLKLIRPRAYALLQLRHIELLYEFYTSQTLAMEDPRVSVFTDIQHTESVTTFRADPRFISQVETILWEMSFLRSLSYDELNSADLASTLSHFARRLFTGRPSGDTELADAHDAASFISPTYLDPRITFPFSRTGAWDTTDLAFSTGELLTSHTDAMPLENDYPDKSSVDPRGGRRLQAIIDRLPVTDFVVELRVDISGYWSEIDPISYMDRYAPYRGEPIDYLGALSELSETTCGLIEILKRARPEYEQRGHYLDRLGILIEKTYHDEVRVTYRNRVTGLVYWVWEADLTMSSLTSFGLFGCMGLSVINDPKTGMRVTTGVPQDVYDL